MKLKNRPTISPSKTMEVGPTLLNSVVTSTRDNSEHLPTWKRVSLSPVLTSSRGEAEVTSTRDNFEQLSTQKRDSLPPVLISSRGEFKVDRQDVPDLQKSVHPSATSRHILPTLYTPLAHQLSPTYSLFRLTSPFTTSLKRFLLSLAFLLNFLRNYSSAQRTYLSGQLFVRNYSNTNKK